LSERDLTSAYENALDDATVAAAFFVYIDWPGGAVRFWSGNGSKSWDSQTWEGVGHLGSIDKIAESVEKTDTGVELTLNYLDDDTRNEVNTNDPIGQDASIWLNLMNVTTGAVSESKEVFTGYVDRVEIEDAGSTGVIKVRLAHEAARLKTSRFFALSHSHQQFLFAGDLGMEFASRMDQPITWGRYPVPVIPRGPHYPDPYDPNPPNYGFPTTG
jgi:hypothetical protein